MAKAWWDGRVAIERWRCFAGLGLGPRPRAREVRCYWRCFLTENMKVNTNRLRQSFNLTNQLCVMWRRQNRVSLFWVLCSGEKRAPNMPRQLLGAVAGGQRTT